MLAIHSILCPTDFSTASENAFRLACALARDYGARLLVLHVVERPLLMYAGVMAPPAPERSAEDWQELHERLHRIRPEDPGLAVEHLLVEGEAGNAILRISQEHGCDMIVMGSHGRTGLYRLLMGSVAEQVSRKADCPVLTITSRVRKTSTVPAQPSREPAAVG